MRLLDFSDMHLICSHEYGMGVQHSASLVIHSFIRWPIGLKLKLLTGIRSRLFIVG